MDMIMTQNTNSNNIKPMLACIAFVVMVLLCLLTTRTFKSIGSWQFASRNGVINGVHGLNSVRELSPSPSLASPVFGFACLCLAVSDLATFAVFGSIVSSCAVLALRLKSVFRGSSFIKLRNELNFLADTALFCFNGFRHVLFLVKKLCLEPLQAQYLCGSLYCNQSLGNVNG